MEWNECTPQQRLLIVRFYGDQKYLDNIVGEGEGEIAAIEADQDEVAKEFWGDPNTDRRKPPPPPPPWWY